LKSMQINGKVGTHRIFRCCSPRIEAPMRIGAADGSIAQSPM